MSQFGGIPGNTGKPRQSPFPPPPVSGATEWTLTYNTTTRLYTWVDASTLTGPAGPAGPAGPPGAAPASEILNVDGTMAITTTYLIIDVQAGNVAVSLPVLAQDHQVFVSVFDPGALGNTASLTTTAAQGFNNDSIITSLVATCVIPSNAGMLFYDSANDTWWATGI